MSFDHFNLNNALRNALIDLAFDTASPIQTEVFAPIMSGKDLVGIAQTGTGKTLAYLLPILRQLPFSEQKHPRVLILVPTRELAEQVKADTEALSTYMSLRVQASYGGVNINTQAARLMEQGMDILISTPGRLIDLALNKAVNLKKIKQLVIDEVDEMLNLGFQAQIDKIFDLLPEKKQNLLFSATLSDEINNLIQALFWDPVIIKIASSGSTAENIKQFKYLVPNFNTKINLLNYLLSTDESMIKVLIFTPSKKNADLIFDALLPENQKNCGVIHSNKSQNLRLRMIDEFNSGKIRFLIATDLIARGLDIGDISHVINIDIPEEPAAYIHRIGRTARAGKEGISIALVSEQELSGELEYLSRIENSINTLIEQLQLPKDLKISDILSNDEIETFKQKNAQKHIDHIKHSGGAFHDKELKNTKVNKAQEKRLARKLEKKRAKRKKKG